MICHCGEVFDRYRRAGHVDSACEACIKASCDENECRRAEWCLTLGCDGRSSAASEYCSECNADVEQQAERRRAREHGMRLMAAIEKARAAR